MDVGGGGGVKSDINVTPLVDVVLVLLIIFMVVTPMLQKGKDVLLPVTANPEESKSEEENEVLVSVTQDGTVYVGSTRVNASEFLRMMIETYERSPGKKVVIKGDRRLAFGDVKDVMLAVNESGFTNVAIMAEEKQNAASGQ
jgi:biopolymer transport protein ExbD